MGALTRYRSRCILSLPHMTDIRPVARLLAELDRGPVLLEDARARVREDAGWSPEQLDLFVRCHAALEVVPGPPVQIRLGTLSAEDDLDRAVVEVVRSFAGRAVAAAEVRKRLP